MASAEGYRQLVEARAGGACEYCRLLQAACGVTFHIDHFQPTSQNGETAMSNLVLSCPGCNLENPTERTAKTMIRRYSLFSIQEILNRHHSDGIFISNWIVRLASSWRELQQGKRL